MGAQPARQLADPFDRRVAPLADDISRPEPASQGDAVGEHNVLPDADPADDGLTDLPAPMTTTTLILLPRWFFYAWFCRARSWEPSASPRYLPTICCMCSG